VRSKPILRTWRLFSAIFYDFRPAGRPSSTISSLQNAVTLPKNHPSLD
jgi:hypothetical protein